MKKLSVLLVAGVLLAACQESTRLPRAEATPAQKESFDKMFPWVWDKGTNELHAALVIQNDKVIYERTDAGHTIDGKHVLWSVSKTFTATAVGFAVQEGRLRVEDRMVDIIGDLCPDPLPEGMDEITVWHLLTMSSGLATEARETARLTHPDADWARAVLSAPMHFRPGEYFEYNSMGSYLLSVIVSRVTGERVDNYLATRLFKPLGITDWWWEASPQDYSAGGWGLYLSAESLAKMGLLMLHKGEWKGRRLLPESWFDAAMSTQILQYKGRITDPGQIAALSENDWQQGYGYQMWHCTHDAYRLDGAWGQFCVIIPDKNAVVVLLSHTTDLQGTLRGVWNFILPVL